jgi:hypothetical protein
MYFLPKKGLGVVVLTNLRVANSFLAAARHKVFELVFGAPAKAEKMIAAASLSAKDADSGISQLRRSASIDHPLDRGVQSRPGLIAESGIAPRTRPSWLS